MLNVLNPMS